MKNFRSPVCSNAVAHPKFQKMPESKAVNQTNKLTVRAENFAKKETKAIFSFRLFFAIECGVNKVSMRFTDLA